MNSPSSSLSRRRFLVGCGVAAATASFLSPGRVFAGEGSDNEGGIVALMRKQGATAKITTQPLRNNITVLFGAGGNIAVLTGRDGKVLVDAGIATGRRQVAEALASIGPEPVKYLINSHWHFDHTDGNAWLHADGASILGHENTRKRLATDTWVEGWRHTFPATPAEALPVLTFKDSMTLHLNDTTLSLESFDPAHTDSDIVVEFKEADVIHVGDVWWNGHYPFIDYSTGGSIDGTIRAVKKSLTLATDRTIIVPGHGPLGDRSQLASFLDMLTTVRERVATMKAQGKSPPEVVAAKPTREFDRKYGDFLTSAAVFTTLVYAGV